MDATRYFYLFFLMSCALNAGVAKVALFRCFNTCARIIETDVVLLLK